MELGRDGNVGMLWISAALLPAVIEINGCQVSLRSIEK